MLPCNPKPWTGGQILLAILSLLTVLDATTVPPSESSKITTANAAASTQRLTTSISETMQSSSVKQSSVTPPVPTQSTAHSQPVSETTLRNVIETVETESTNTTEMQISLQTSATLPPNITDGKQLMLEHSITTITFPKAEPTTEAVLSTKSATMPQTTSIELGILSTQTTSATGSITCLGLGDFTSTSQVACFQYKEETTCEKLDKEKKEELRSFLCKLMKTTECNVTIHSSEVQPNCILWVPTSRDAENSLQNETFGTDGLLPAMIKWGQISDHQTKSQKTMIALVTCGVLLAAFILAGYFLSNRESWSPGRQRLGEDPYCTETDSQGNTLVSVSAHAQDKPNSATRENGTGQTVSPTATNGHSTKKQTVSDTEL